jgi:hypothetical protein
MTTEADPTSGSRTICSWPKVAEGLRHLTPALPLLALFTKCLEVEFYELRLYGVLGRAHPGSCIAPVQRVSAPFRRGAYPLAIIEN